MRSLRTVTRQARVKLNDDGICGPPADYTPDLKVAAYEVLFRDSAENASNIADGDQATAELILNLFAEIGVQQIVGDVPAFINVTRNFILDGHVHALPKEQVVVEVLEDVRPEPQVLDALRNLSAEGYTIALDDFVYAPELQPLVEIADIIKVELPAIRAEDLPHHVQQLRNANVKLLAEKVETYQEFERCKQLGFDYFQGYFFCKPKVIQGTRVPVNRVAALQLLSRLRHSNVKMTDLAQILSKEPALCYKLLRFVNSAACALSRRIDSIKAAVTLVGLQRMHSFTRLALLARVAEEKPPHLVVTARLERGCASCWRRPQTASARTPISSPGCSRCSTPCSTNPCPKHWIACRWKRRFARHYSTIPDPWPTSSDVL